MRRTPIHVYEVQRIETRDMAYSYDRCRVCGRIVCFTTDGNGRLVVLDRHSLRRHVHQIPEA